MPDELPSGPIRPDAAQRDSLLGVAFPATNWSMVLRAQREGAEVQTAMNELCRRYWYPVYAYLRCRGYSRCEAQDITQSFFLHAVTGGLIHNAEPSRGRLRSFLLGALSRHVADHQRHQHAQKRGGRAIVLPLECDTAEDRFGNEPADLRDPEKLYLAAWAGSLIESARRRVRSHMERKGQAELFDHLQPAIEMDEDATPYRDVAERVHTSEAALRLLVFRLRRRFAAALREEVARTVERPEEIEDEMAWLSQALHSC